MTSQQNRRRFLQLTGAGTAATLAGCSALDSLGSDDDTGGGEYDDLLTAAVGPSSEDVQELQEAIENEEIDMQEAQQREAELFEEAAAEFEQRAEDDDDLEIVDAEAEQGVYRIDSSASSAIEALQDGPALALYEGATYDQIIAQQEQQEEMPDEEVDPDEDLEVEEDADDADDVDDDAEEEADDADDADGEEEEADDAEEAADDTDDNVDDADDATNGDA
jgi:hypothetical protein